MKKIIFVLLIVLTANHVRADFVASNFYTLTLTAQQIAAGEIICVDEKVFELKIDKSISKTDEVLTIRKFEDWTCAIRWTEYHIGQRIMIFLDEDENGLYPMGGGNEGELPILNDMVYISALSLPFDMKEYKRLISKPEYVKNDSGPFLGLEMELDLLWGYIKTIRDCFEFELREYKRIKSATFVCPKEKINTLRQRHKIYDWTLTRLITDANNTYSK